MSLPRRTPMPPRKKPMKRTGSLKRTGRIKPKKRTKAEAERIYGTDARRDWMTSHRCFTCGMLGLTEQAHLVSGGTSRKADARHIIPLCHWCHREQHRVGLADFAEAHGLAVQDLHDEAERLDRAWNAHLEA